jgi:hypothetical protein
MFGSLYISRMLDVFPRLLWIGGAILGGVAGALMIEDPILGGAFASATSTADVLVPLVAALYVVLQSKIIIDNRAALAQVKPPSTLLAIFGTPKPSAVPGKPVARREPPPLVTAQGQKSALTEAGPPLQASAAASAVKRPPGAAVQSSPAKEPPSSQGTTRLLFGVGVVVMVVAGLGYYVVTSPLLPSPEGFKTYRCVTPPFEIAYLPNASKIRFASGSGVVTAQVLDGRVVWKDYRAASISLGIPPPNNIMSADATKMVVSGGMFENAECRVAGK